MRDEDKRAIKSLLIKAKAKAAAYQKAEQAVFYKLNELGISDPQNFGSEAENADNLEEAISCWLSYNEYSIGEIMREIESAVDNTELMEGGNG